MTRAEIIELARKCGAADSAFTLGGMKRYTFTDAALEAFFHAAQKLGVEDALSKVKSLHEHECSAAAHHSGRWQPAYEYHMTRQAAVSDAMQAIRNRGTK